MADLTTRWDSVPLWAIYLKGDQITPVNGEVVASVNQRIHKVDGRVIFPEGAQVRRTIGVHGTEDAAIRNAVRDAWRAADQAAAGGSFDGAAWDARWEVLLDAAVFFEFPASDDPDIIETGYEVRIDEHLEGAVGKTFYVQPLLSDLARTPPGLDLATVAVPPGSPTAPAPIYQKGTPGGVAALTAEGFVTDANGNVLDPDLLGGGGDGGATVEQTVDALGTDKLETAPEIVKTYDSTAKVINLSLAASVESVTGAQTKATAARDDAVAQVQTSIDAKAPIANPTFTGTVAGVTKTHVGLGSVDNTADSAKPVSTAQAAALAAKAPLASPAFTGTPTGITKTHVGLGNVDNTADTAKPVSAAQQAALDAKAAAADLIDVQTDLATLGEVTTSDLAKVPVSEDGEIDVSLLATYTQPMRTVTAASYTVVAADLGRMVNLTGTGDATVTLPADAALSHGDDGGFTCRIRAARSGVINLTSAGSFINVAPGRSNFGVWKFHIPQFGVVDVTRITSSEWAVTGDVVAVEDTTPTLVQAPATVDQGASASLAAPATAGSTLLMGVRTVTGYTTPAGWTELVSRFGSGTIGVVLLAKVAAGGEQTFTPPGGGNGSIIVYEVAGLAPIATLYDGVNSVTASNAASTTWDPASVQVDQASGLYLTVTRQATAVSAPSAWAGADESHNTTTVLSGYKAVGDGAAWDTAVTWTGSSAIQGILACLRGA